MPSTVYQRVIIKHPEHSRKDLRRIANWVNSIYSKDRQEEPPKVEQNEGELTFMVYSYPDEMIPIIDNIVEKFFKNKAITAERHNQYLKELVECKIDGKAIKPQPKSAPPRGKYIKNDPDKKPASPAKQFVKPQAIAKTSVIKPIGEDSKSSLNLSKINYTKKTEIPNEIPVATTLRKRKTAQGAVLINKN